MPPGVLAEHDANDLLLHSVGQKTQSSSKGIKKRHCTSKLEDESNADDISKVSARNLHGLSSPPNICENHPESHFVSTTCELPVTSSASLKKIDDNHPHITVTGVASL